jgi:acyl-CoA thioesterase FadM
MNKKFGDKMEVGDKVVIRTWAYAVSTKRVQCSAALMKDGAKGQIERVIDRNAVIVRYSNGLVAPVHPSAVYPEV